jgi:hypothetical protein
MNDRHKRRLWWIWAIWGAAFLVIEGYAIATKEKAVPTLSRTYWWFRDHWKWVAIAIIVIGGVLLILHLAGGECAFGLCL